jgi:ABC-2 type transport system ATP-binding protein
MRTTVDAAIETTDLSCRYGRHEAVRGITFAVQPGTIFALLGPNGAGKTTTIRVLMNILRPASGHAHVLGVDSRRLGPTELESIGYVSENQELPGWMTVTELLSFCRPFYRTWDDGLCSKLIADFDLPRDVKIGRLSRGMRVKAALVSALAYRPALLVLDEPFSGLDPVVRDDLVAGVLERAGEERWTVLISSHDLDEVERLVDSVAFMDAGRLVLSEPLTGLLGRFRRVEITVANKNGEPEEAFVPERLPDGWIGMTRSGRLVRFVETRHSGSVLDEQIAALFPGARVEIQLMTLREIFVALVRQTRARSEGQLR